MRSKSIFATLTIAAVVLLSSGNAQALKLHNFDCGLCHNPGAVWTSVDGGTQGNICLQCHGSSLTPTTLNSDYSCVWDGTRVVCTTNADPDGASATPGHGFAVGEASNKLGSNAAPGAESSHNWGAPIYNPRAGSASQGAADTMYNVTTASRQGSAGFVTCFRCHDPHGAKKATGTDGTNKLVRFPGYDKADPATMVPTPEKVESTCTVCHSDWAAITTAENALESHPLVTNYPAFAAANPDRFKAFTPSGEMQLVNGGQDMGCTTCHGLHSTDSNSGTTDGVDDGAGDGALLLGDGRSIDANAVCNACHIYQTHPSSSGTPVGCLDCHSGHSYNDGTPNYYILRGTFDAPAGSSLPTAGTTINGMRFTTDPDTITAAERWAGSGSTGFCEYCHGDIENSTAGYPSENRPHTEGENCQGCHVHHNASSPGESFAPVNCDGCHGFPPVNGATAGGPDGYAVNGANNYFTSGVYKNESNTGHITHASGTGNYTFACNNCHGAGSNTSGHAGHDTGTFQEVFQLAALPQSTLATDGGNLSPNYATGGSGTCSAVYCHSNGGPRGAVPTTSATNPTWANANGSINACDVCHGNTAVTMTTRNNSATHNAHLSKGYACGVCHASTATNNTTLLASAIGGSGAHVNGAPDVSADLFQAGLAGSFTYASAAGTCQNAYCHSNGSGTYSTPDWDSAATGACGTCHATTGPGMSGSHDRHLTDADGPQISDCSLCHTHNGSGADHVNGAITVNYTNCRGCHGTNGGTGNDADLGLTDWTNGTASCETCHIGVTSVIPAAGTRFSSARSATAKNAFIAEGHGDTGLTGAPTCTGCHNAADLGHFDTVSGDDNRLLTLGGTTYGTGTETAWCQECHAGVFAHFDNNKTPGGNSDNGHQCYICHEPHGEGVTAGFDAMLLANVGGIRNITGFTNRNVASSYFNGTTSGVCQVCHDQAEVTHYHDNSVGGQASGDGHNSTTNCISCHQHTSNPAFQGGECFSCHGDNVSEYWPQNAGNNRAFGAVSDFNDDGRHTAHVTAIASEVMGQNLTQLLTDNAGVGNAPYDTMSADAKQKAICGYCHVVGDGDHAALDASLAEVFPVGGKKKIWDGSNDADASFSTVNFSCSTTDCHDSKTTTTVGPNDYSWYGSDTATCIMCHEDVTSGATANTTGSTHQAHLGAATNYGINTITCDTCHDAATNWATNTAPATGHRNGAWTLDAFTYSVSYPTSGGNCGTNYCHNDGTGTGAPKTTVAWATDNVDPNCGLCHDAAPTTRKHPDHLANTTFVPVVVGGITDRQCDNCHGLNPEEQTTHINLTVNKANRLTSYSGGTCANACHNDDATNDWTLTGTLSCTDCHGSGKDTTGFAVGGAALDRGWPPTSQPAHAAHTTNTSYVAANCVDCHNSNVSGHSAINGTATSPTLGAKISAYTAASGTCTNTCHGGIADFRDSTPSPLCVDCHSGTFIGGNNVAKGFNATPSSGLHATTNALAHDVSFGSSATCTSCHQATPSAAHVTGTLQNPTQTTFNFVAANIVSYNRTTGCMASCHTDGADWRRKWLSVTDAVPGASNNPGDAVCDNCHGDFSNGWRWSEANATTTDHTDPYNGNVGDQVQSQHGVCETCHGWGNANYDKAWGAPSANNGHGDGFITMNGPNGTGAGYNDPSDTTAGCTAACHTETPFVMNANSGWNENYGNFGSGDCAGCHNGNGVTHGGAAGLALHNAHNNSPYVDANTNFVYGTSATYDNCNTCHGHNGAANHYNGTVEFAGTITSGSNYSFATGFVSAGDNCTNTCHNNDAGDWAAGNLGGDSCTDCHAATGELLDQGGYPPTSNRHDEHLNSNYTAVCTDCHTHNGAALTGDHGNTTIQMGGNVTGGTLPSCTNSCHNVTTFNWTSAQTAGLDLECADCHGSGKTYDAGNDAWASVNTRDGKHGTHAGAYTYGATGQTATGAGVTYDYGCGTCHNGTHLNGTLPLTMADIEVTVANYTQGSPSTCGTNSCHQNGNSGAPATIPTWGTVFAGDRCNKCHGNAPATGAHDVHEVGIHWQDIYTGGTGLLTTGSAAPSAHGRVAEADTIDCRTCHFNTVTAQYNALKTSCNTCHSDTNSPATGNEAMVVSLRQNHVNGAKDVVFHNLAYKTKAQLRNDITTVTEVNTYWQRRDASFLAGLFYKAAGDHDVMKATLQSTASFSGGTCSTVACHNGRSVTWQPASGNCAACHTELPQ